MKRLVSTLLGMTTISMMLVSCTQSLQTNERLGKIVSLMQDEQNKKAELEQKANDCKDAECLGKLVDESNKLKEKYESDLKAEIESLKGKDIPTEVKNLPVKLVKAAAIKEINSFKRPQCEAEIEFTKDVTLNSHDDYYSCSMLISFIDKEGHSLGNQIQSLTPGLNFEKGMTIKAGTKFPISFDLMISKKNLENWQNFDKIVFEPNPKR